VTEDAKRTPARHDDHDYAERIRERLSRRLQELRETMGFDSDQLGS
jgi:hypothetical protein